MHEGLIWAQSELGKGLSIFISLPITDKATERIQENMKKILIIEDDLNIQTLEKDYLEANSFSVKTASNGTDGLQLALNEEFDLILLDIMLPEIDGLEICRKNPRCY